MNVTYRDNDGREQTFDERERVRRTVLERAGWTLVESEPDTYRIALPNDIPGYDDLMMANLRTIADVQAVSDLTDIHGIGEATAAKIRDYLAGLEKKQ